MKTRFIGHLIFVLGVFAAGCDSKPTLGAGTAPAAAPLVAVPTPDGNMPQRVLDLQAIKKALESYAASHNGAFPVTNGWNGYVSAWGESLGNDWIPGLAPTYIAKLPRDPAASDKGDGPQYLYSSDGINYKLLAHYTGDCSASAESAMTGIRVDLRRLKPDGIGCNAYGYWTLGGESY